MINCKLISAPYLKTFTIPAHSWLGEDASKVYLTELRDFYLSYSEVLMDIPDLKFNFVGLSDGANLYFDEIQVVKGGQA